MRSSLVLLAALASAALAYPTEKSVEPRTLGLLGELLGDITVDVSSILDAVLGGHSSFELFAGLSAEGAAALQGGALGCKSGAIHHQAKAALKDWLLFHADLDFSLKMSLISWCEGHDELVLSADILAALSVYIPGCADIAAKGQLFVTIDGIFEAASLESALVLSAGAQASLSAWIEAQLDLALEVKIGLNVCAAGGVVGSLSADIKAALFAWINSGGCELSADLKISVLAWINGHAGGDLVEIGALAETALSTVSVGASVGVHVLESGFLSFGGQASLAAFLGVDLAANLAADVKLALEACAKGELATALELDIRTKLAIWLHSSDCTLGVELKAVVLLWLSFAVEADVSVALDLVGGLVGDVTGLLTEGLSVDLRSALSLCAAGGSLLDLTFAARTELAAFIGGCTSIEIDFSIQIIIIEWFTGCSIPGAPSAPASSSVPSLPHSTPYLSSTSAVPSAPGASASISVSVPAGTPVPSGPAASTTPCDTETSVIVGSTVIPGPSGSGSITVTVPVVPTGTGIPGVPSGPAPSGPAPSGPAPSGSAPSGPAPSGPGATTTPCDTETSVIVSSTVIPGPSGSGFITVTVPVVPTGTGVPGVPSGPAPSGPAPSGPAPSGPGATTTPCDTETSVIVSSTVIPGPSGSGFITVTVPVVPTGTGVPGVPSGPAPSGPAPSGPAPSGPGATTTPCDTETSVIVSSTVIPGPSGSGFITVTVPVVPTGTGIPGVPSGPAPSGPAPSGPAPSGPAPSGPAPSGPAPSGPAPPGPGATTTPCDTETSVIVSSTVIPGPSGSGFITVTVPVVPTGTGVPGVPSGPAPSGPAPSGPAPSGPGATTTPCDTETSVIVSSTVIPGPSGSGSITVTVPVVPTGTGIPGVPSGPAPSGPAPSGPAPSGSAPSGPAPSGPGATTTPCDTETSVIVTSTEIPGGPNESVSTTATGPAETPSGVAPTGTPVATGPAPSGPAPSGPAASTPCDTETSAIVTSTVIPAGPAPSGPAVTTEVPVPSGPAPSGPAPSGPAATTEVPIPSGPAPSGPAGTTEVPVPSGPAPTSPPSQPTGGESVVTKTVTVTATVCGCE
ncbi:hypothetical protein PITC_062580 [Penicillium italicum]|uniref:Cell wall protein n=1 Tax=Penicillium italicum TaxID=40296 RepID=A0A0A2KWH6_PENIT|nr:hypothetical protein PITC_062580 [Penicillium italicum]